MNSTRCRFCLLAITFSLQKYFWQAFTFSFSHPSNTLLTRHSKSNLSKNLGSKESKPRRTIFKIKASEDRSDEVPSEEGYGGDAVGEIEMSDLFKRLKQLKLYNDHIAHNWRNGNFEYKNVFVADSKICKLRFSDSLMALGSEKGDVYMVDLATGLVKSEIWAHRGKITALDWDGKVLLTGGTDSCIRFFSSPLASAAYRDQNSLVFRGHSGPVTSLVRMDNEHFASAGMDGKILIWNYMESIRGPVKEIQTPGSVTCLNHYEGYLTAGFPDGTVLAYSAKGERPLLRIKAHESAVSSLHFASENFLVTGGADGQIKFWNLFDGGDHTKKFVAMQLPGEKPRLINRVYQGHTAAVTALQADDEKIVSGSLDGSVRAWDLETGEEIFAFYGHKAVTCLQYNEYMLITDGVEKSVIVHDFS